MADLIEVTDTGVVQVRKDILNNQYHRYCITPGQDYSNESAEIQAICNAVHTPQVIANYAALIG